MNYWYTYILLCLTSIAHAQHHTPQPAQYSPKKIIATVYSTCKELIKISSFAALCGFSYATLAKKHDTEKSTPPSLYKPFTSTKVTKNNMSFLTHGLIATSILAGPAIFCKLTQKKKPTFENTFRHIFATSYIMCLAAVTSTTKKDGYFWGNQAYDNLKIGLISSYAINTIL